ncbi:alpha galactosidase A domain-containing protein [Hirsutella rhossiliensis]|uniref:alpha-galactosidase n=1 Tax=Hirsutella rhossiliensis TaxID=111463 RepID=A0A9P8MUX2_9HYPO|nr:alpha galactosidase A domain-containing protein [Hirsutella rhossiliensis]KAH0961680.1 alpha galactosidase A domain-containing protein [Hirsutella rhossiliensis]
MLSKLALAAATVLVTTFLASSVLSPTPRMGFNDWARYQNDISEQLFKKVAVAMSENGLLQVGYNRINIDDAWASIQLVANGSMVWGQTRSLVGSQYGQMGRDSADIVFYTGRNAWGSMMNNDRMNRRLARHKRPGYFNDPDFLNVDNTTYTLDEKMSHFTLWCSFSAPLIISAD